MIRALSLATVLVAGLAIPAIADDTATRTGPQAVAAKSAPIGNPFTVEDARQHLRQRGYKNVSGLVKDANGKWVGSAIKDGRTVAVAVDLKRASTN